jgi:predicted ester cyclase
MFVPASTQAGEAQNIEVMKAMFEALNDRNLDVLDRYVAQDVVRHSAATPGAKITNLEAFRAFLEADIAAVPDSVQVIDVMFGNDEYVAVRARYMGTQTGPMGPYPPSGNYMELPYIGIARFSGGKIVELWAEWDNLSALTQLKHFSPPDNETIE